MSFEHPYLFILLFAPFILFTSLVLTNKEGLERVFSKETIERIKISGSGLDNKVRNTLFFIAIFFMIIAISHPYIYKGNKKIEISGKDIILALDISASMRAKDRYPNRFGFAKKKIKELIDKLKNDNIMLLAFADSIFLVSPFTNDKETLKEIVSGITDDYILANSDFTALAEVLKDTLKDKLIKIAVIITDGGNKEELKEFEKIILKQNIKLFVILVGTKEGSALRNFKDEIILKNQKVVTTSINDYIATIAKKSGGDYIVANYTKEDINKLAAKIESISYSTKVAEVINIKDRKELFYYPLIVALIFLFFALFSWPNVGKKGFKSEK